MALKDPGGHIHIFRCAEAAFQSKKTSDPAEIAKFTRLDGKAAKAYGRKVTLRPDWEEVKLEAMREVVHIKFLAPDLSRYLLNTGDATLIEGNYWNDTFWGMCRGKGENHLGRILMEERDAIRKIQ